MRLAAFATLLAVLLVVPTGRADDKADIAAALKVYYKGGQAPDYQSAVEKLDSQNALDERRKAADYLRALLTRALQDEKDEASLEKTLPQWPPDESLPHKLRAAIANEIRGQLPTAEVAPVLSWYFDHETDSSLQHLLLHTLRWTPGQEADALRVRLIVKPHPNAFVVAAALKQLEKSKAPVPADVLTSLCQHYRGSIRQAAYGLNQARGGPVPPPFDAVKAFRTPAIQRILEQIAPLVAERPPEDARFVRVTLRSYNRDGKRIWNRVLHGFVITEDDEKLEILTPSGWHETFMKQPGWETDRKGGSTIWTQADCKLDDEVLSVEQLRDPNDPQAAIGERDDDAGPYLVAGSYEILLADWLHHMNKDDLAARILLPALDTFYEDRFLVEHARRSLALGCGQQMLSAFVGDRNYERAELLAERLVKYYPHSPFYAYAERLKRELPRRRADFAELKLPTPSEWRELRATLTHDEQIDFLCKRLRLVNYIQEGLEPLARESGEQYGEPCGMDHGARTLRRGTTRVINPYAELCGEDANGAHDIAGTPERRFELTPADVPRLVPYLREDWLLLEVPFWGRYPPFRRLVTSRCLVGWAINCAAGQDRFRDDEFEAMSPTEQEKHLQSILDWARRHPDGKDK